LGGAPWSSGESHGSRTWVRNPISSKYYMEKDGPLGGRKYNENNTAKWGKSHQRNIFFKNTSIMHRDVKNATVNNSTQLWPFCYYIFSGESLDYQQITFPCELLLDWPDSYFFVRRHNFQWEAKIISILDINNDEKEVKDYNLHYPCLILQTM